MELKELPHAMYAYQEVESGFRCVAYARRMAAKDRWEVKVVGTGNRVEMVPDRDEAKKLLQQLVDKIGGKGE